MKIYLNKYNIHLIVIIQDANQDKFIETIKNLFPNILFKVEFFKDNKYEYRGINKVWEIGQINKNRNDIILYYHSKGITRNKTYNSNIESKNDWNICLKYI